MNLLRPNISLAISLTVGLSICSFLVSCKGDDPPTLPADPGPPANITLSTSTLSFTSEQGGGNPTSQAVSVTNGGGGSLTGLSVTISYTAGSGWLTATLNTTTAPATITLQAATGSLNAGSYTATVSVASPVASNSPRQIAVTFTVSAASPSITLSSSSITFTAVKGGGNPTSQAVSVTNGGGGSLTGLSVTISYTAGSGWLTATLNTTTAPATITLQAATGSLNAGSYTATVSVASPVASNSPRQIAVTFTVSSGGEVSQTFFSSADNNLIYSSVDPTFGDKVFAAYEIAVGTNYSYDMLGGFNYASAACLIQFNAQSLIAGKTVLEAKFQLYEYDPPADPAGNFRIAAVSTSWNPATVTWNNYMKYGQHYIDHTVNFKAIFTTAVPIEFDVTAIVQNWANGTWSNNGFLVYEPNPVAPGYESYQADIFQSMERYIDRNHRPQLYIRYR